MAGVRLCACRVTRHPRAVGAQPAVYAASCPRKAVAQLRARALQRLELHAAPCTRARLQAHRRCAAGKFALSSDWNDTDTPSRTDEDDSEMSSGWDTLVYQARGKEQ